MKKPLAGVRVLSMAGQFPGPYATLLLADLGADVVIVERPPAGDPARFHEASFAALNRGKRGVMLDLKNPGERETLYRLIGRADVFLEGSRPGVAKRLGVAYEDLAPRNPRLIYVSISAFGQTGPYRLRPAHDIALQALAGTLSGREKDVTETLYLPLSDLSSGTFAALGVAAALVQRQATGKGCEIDVSMADTLLSWLTFYLGPVLNGQRMNETRFPGFGCYECKDGRWIAFSVTFEDHHWRPLADAVGLGEFADVPAEARIRDFARIDGALRAAVAGKTRGEWVTMFADMEDLSFMPVNEPSEVVEDPHFAARGLFVDVPGSEGERRHIAQPLKFNGETLAPERSSPRLGEHDPEAIWRD